ncbi:MAG: acyltransferase domain-containing protein, partial [Ktedonobacteraceae bacterium]
MPLFRAVIEACDLLLHPLTGGSLLEDLLAEETVSRMQRTDVAQPALFALQIALVAVWQSWGIEPQAVIGHSVGEIAAAYVAGVLNLEDAIQVIFQRSRLQELTAGQGKMLAVALSAEEARAMIAPFGERVTLAAINAPCAVTLAGEAEALHQCMALLEEQSVFCRMLPLNYAFHSSMMDPLEEDLRASLHNLHPQAAQLPFLSTVTGGMLGGPECDADYWWKNVRWPVQFASGIQQLCEPTPPLFLEIGPHPVLSAYIMECLDGHPVKIIPSLRRHEDEYLMLLNSLGSLYTLGAPVAWEKLVEQGQSVALPHYPWQRVQHWNASDRLFSPEIHPLLGTRCDSVGYITWENTLNKPHLSYLQEHRGDNTALFPFVGYLEILFAAAFDHYKATSCMI